jgi:hypothetical protein
MLRVGRFDHGGIPVGSLQIATTLHLVNFNFNLACTVNGRSKYSLHVIALYGKETNLSDCYALK